MPSGKAHTAVAALTYAALALAQHTPPELTLAGAAVAGLAALGPDLDLPGSTASRLFWPLTAPLAWLLSRFFTHRGTIHGLAVALLVAAVAWHFLPVAFAVAITWGWCSHLLLDAGQPAGIPTWPGGPRLRLWFPTWK